MILSRASSFKHCSKAYANRLIRAMLKPWKLFFLISSYRLILSHGQNTEVLMESVEEGKVLPHEFKGDAEVISEVEVVYHVDDVVLVISVL